MENCVYYCSRREVLFLLRELIRSTLSYEECRFLMAYCGYPQGDACTFRDLSLRFSLHGSAHAKAVLRRIILTVRKEIPTSPLAPYLCGLDHLMEENVQA